MAGQRRRDEKLGGAAQTWEEDERRRNAMQRRGWARVSLSWKRSRSWAAKATAVAARTGRQHGLEAASELHGQGRSGQQLWPCERRGAGQDWMAGNEDEFFDATSSLCQTQQG
ncbi:hypothetical protein M0R45_018305 [Rubus argutus]|uniref:Uncharacterized protein n=1 Tax=Rubus argutus TaxID=59490 RepID=A0AAW1X5K1_RUBAR